MALNTVSSDRLSTNVKNTNFTAAEKQDLTDDIKPLLGSSGGGSKNLIVNGAQLVAQRGTSSTSDSYQTIDRFAKLESGTDESVTQSQVDVAAGTTPYTNGFRKSFRLTNGNQTSGAGAGDNALIRYKVEAQDIANSGWNYVSSSSNITLSFWIKSSVAQNFYFNFIAPDGTSYNYPMETGSLTADTWTKITKTIPGNSNLTFNNDNGVGLQIDWWAFAGTNYTASGVTLNQWAAYSSGNRFPDNTSTWWTTNDATLEITGVQLEIGSVATEFDHRSFAVEKKLCERYFKVFSSFSGIAAAAGVFQGPLQFDMRATPSASLSPSGKARITDSAFADFDISSGASLNEYNATPTAMRLHVAGFSGLSTQKPMTWLATGTNQSDVHLAAEL